MIWIAWRFQRSVVCALALLALIVIGFAVITGTMQHHDLMQFMGAPCHGRQSQIPGRGDICGKLAVKLANIRTYNTFIEAAGLIIAPLVGALLGLLALASEVDNRTVRLAWTQSISRTRWFAFKVGVGAALVAVLLVPTAITLSWWNGAIGEEDLFAPQTYGIAGWDLVAYGLFMFALTVLLGAVIRRVGWTLAVSVLLFLVVALAVPSRVRTHLVTPTVKWSQPYLATKGDYSGVSYTNETPQSARLLFMGVIPRSTVGLPTWSEVNATTPRVLRCENGYPMKTQNEYVKGELACYKKLHVENVAVYIADDQFWTLQLREGLLYLSAGLILAGGALMFIRRIEP
jgi:hypothetical protein